MPEASEEDMDESLTLLLEPLQALTAVRKVDQAVLREVRQLAAAVFKALLKADQAALTAALTALPVVFW